MRFACVMSVLAAIAAFNPSPAAAAATDAPQAGAPSDKSADKAAGGARPADPLANLKPHEERRYRLALDDCSKEKGTERRVCERSVRRHAEAKSRRRSAPRY